MIKALIQGSVIVLLFFATWFAFKQVNWMSVFKVQKLKDNTEEKLGNLIWDVIRKSEKENTTPFVLHSMEGIVDRICTENDIDRTSLKVHVINKDEVNAFALPNGHLVVYSGLILAADTPEELSGVICHEIAHIELSHVMKKMVKEIGLSALISMTAGNGGPEMIIEAAKLLSSSAFDRKMEQEADIKAVDYMVKANLNPEHFANFLYKLAHAEGKMSKYLSWISTHPESKKRAEYIVEHSRHKKVTSVPVLTEETWERLKSALKNDGLPAF